MLKTLFSPQFEIFTYNPSSRHNQVPPDKPSSVPLGILVHLGPIIVFCLILAYIGITVTNVLLVSFPISFIGLGLAIYLGNILPAVELPKMSFKTFLRAFLWDIMGKGFGVGLIILISVYSLLMFLFPHEVVSGDWLRMLMATMMADFWYYSIHRWFMHSKGSSFLIKKLRKEHSVHHSITDLDFFRGNKGSILDNGVVSFAASLAIFSIILGLDLASALLVYIILMGVQVTHHVNHSFDIGILKYIIFDSHAHKIHHCKRGRHVNFAAVFAIWDRLFGTYYEDWDRCPSYMHANNIHLPIKPIQKNGSSEQSTDNSINQ